MREKIQGQDEAGCHPWIQAIMDEAVEAGERERAQSNLVEGIETGRKFKLSIRTEDSGATKSVHYEFKAEDEGFNPEVVLRFNDEDSGVNRIEFKLQKSESDGGFRDLNLAYQVMKDLYQKSGTKKFEILVNDPNLVGSFIQMTNDALTDIYYQSTEVRRLEENSIEAFLPSVKVGEAEAVMKKIEEGMADELAPGIPLSERLKDALTKPMTGDYTPEFTKMLERSGPWKLKVRPAFRKIQAQNDPEEANAWRLGIRFVIELEK